VTSILKKNKKSGRSLQTFLLCENKIEKMLLTPKGNYDDAVFII